MKHPLPVILSESDRASLHTFIHAGKANARTFTRARALLKADEGWSDQQICAAFEISRNTSIRVRQLYLQGGLEAVLHDKRQQRYRQALSGGQAAHLIAIACSPVPDGHDHWTLRRFSGKAVELGFVEAISPETIRQLLKKTNSSRGNTSNGVSLKEVRSLWQPWKRCSISPKRNTIPVTPRSASTKSSSLPRPMCGLPSLWSQDSQNGLITSMSGWGRPICFSSSNRLPAGAMWR